MTRRSCEHCHFLVRHQSQLDGTDPRIQYRDVLWSETDTRQLRLAVQGEGKFHLVVQATIGSKFGAACWQGIFQDPEGEPGDMLMADGRFPRRIAGQESEALTDLLARVDKKVGQSECYFWPRREGMELDAAAELQGQGLRRRRERLIGLRSWAALALSVVATSIALLAFLRD